MFEYNEDYLRQRIRDLNEGYKQYHIQPKCPVATKTKPTSNIKKLLSYVIYLIG